ncbi:unnamed protein product, partial [Ixodes persulcatus]
DPIVRVPRRGRPRRPDGHNCPFCPYGTRKLGNLKQHVRVHTGERPFSSNAPDGLQLMLGYVESSGPHGKPSFECNACSYQTERKAHIMRHLRGHAGERPYSCQHCVSAFVHKHHLDRHTRQLHGSAVKARKGGR